MDWSFKPLARQSALSGKSLEVGERVVCFIVIDDHGEVQRVDIREREASQLPQPERILGRWTRLVKQPERESCQAREGYMARAEALFFSLFSVLGREGEVEVEQQALKQVLALMLERKRILRAQGQPVEGVQLYVHVKTKRKIKVHMGPLEPDRLMGLQEKLNTLMREA